jgi:ssRNA-specific RNase YbeY (16S rRNA maturation enzyme)
MPPIEEVWAKARRERIRDAGAHLAVHGLLHGGYRKP